MTLYVSPILLLALGLTGVIQEQAIPRSSDEITQLHAVAFAPRASPHSQAQSSASTGTYTMHVNADEVVLNCTVLNSKGELVNDLTKDGFAVSEDKTRQKVISLQHQDIPVSIGMLIDNSGSMRNKREAVTTAALDLIKASNPRGETFVVNFSDQLYFDQDFTDDLQLLKRGLAHVNSSGGTALYDTIVSASQKMGKTASRSRHVLIVITDGQDNASKLALDNAIHSVQDMQGPIIYSIGLLFDTESSRGEVHRARRDLETLSKETGGIAFFPKSLEDIDHVAAEVAQDIRNQYTLSYHSSRSLTAGYHSVTVEAHHSGRDKMIVHTRSGCLSKGTPENNTGSSKQ